MQNKGLTYQEAGVDIDKGNRAVELIKPLVKSTFRKEVVTDLGGFGGLFALDNSKYEQPVLVSGTDGVGTKLKLAFMMNKHNTIGIDAVAMCVNDILVSGAEPLFFLDYLAVGGLDPEQVKEIVEGIAEGCKRSECALIGGETAEMPGFYSPGEYDVAGFSVGVVDKSKIIDGKSIKPGDIVLGLPSTGIHSNGFSLVRKVLLEKANLSLDEEISELGDKLGNVLLEPTKIYVKLIKALLEKVTIKGMAHITGGGLIENIPRILPEGTDVVLNKGSWPKLPIFELIKKLGNISEEEMHRTFNMGIGMILIVDPSEEKVIIDLCEGLEEKVFNIGTVTEGHKKVSFREGINL
ncbi:phosphoribosylformylglycinamidine cyclo-ligase [Desulfonispora thiosulfatigenes DSM 11270]|uniref:Phosphoribosylformylglycinamidine cyclo-ligase n=1 Tax=Desulfonispora thiosulfatigenes DSM 11270 TaxID=656914 RepID=A0A1W1VE29_DESTI|nr:phosphoribosylformylglycinamidine cyclo-ligase [Desulfonispora thiosulfatigenes]SMB91632.1 phosphoribosylformylglycinamidine cyclo-ligase [Desulfonispora thiosulfatigenes DSM 11270]